MEHMFRNAIVGDDGIHFFDAADAAEASFAEFAGVGENNGALGYSNHFAVELGFHYVGGAEAKFEVDAIHAKEEFAAGEIVEYALGIAARGGGGAFAQHATQYQYFNFGLPVQFHRHVECGGNHG